MKAQLPRPQWIEPDEVITTGTPGIVVHRHDISPWSLVAPCSMWFVVHEASGQRLAAWKRPDVDGDHWGRPLGLAYDNEAQAVEVADALAGLADWTVGAEQLHAEVGRDVIELLYRIGDAAEGVTA